MIIDNNVNKDLVENGKLFQNYRTKHMNFENIFKDSQQVGTIMFNTILGQTL